MKNAYGKSRPVTDPYFVQVDGSWTWKVLKLYKSPEASLKDQYARAFCAVSSPHTFGSYDLGDVYVNEIPGFSARLHEIVRLESLKNLDAAERAAGATLPMQRAMVDRKEDA